MALSNSYDFTLTAAQVIAGAYRKIGVSSASTTQNANALEALEIILKSFRNKGYNLTFPWAQEQITQALTASTSSYTLNAKVTNIDQAFIRRSGNDTLVKPWTKEEYYAASDKTLEGLPNRFWADKQYTGITLYLYPVPENSTDVLHMLAINKIQDIDNSSNDIQVDESWFRALTYSLAAEVALDESISQKEVSALLILAQTYTAEAKNGSGDLGNIRIFPEGAYAANSI